MVAERVGFEPTCRLRDKTLSRRPRYDHFGTSPQRQHRAPAHGMAGTSNYSSAGRSRSAPHEPRPYPGSPMTEKPAAERRAIPISVRCSAIAARLMRRWRRV